jgi:hypothetical protein
VSDRLYREADASAKPHYRVVWRKMSNRHDREILYVAADSEAHALEICRAYVKREFQVRKPVIIEVGEMS